VSLFVWEPDAETGMNPSFAAEKLLCCIDNRRDFFELIALAG
jgi:hypothetical protein